MYSILSLQKYDVMNDLMSFGIHRLWKRFTIDCSGVRRGQTVLDLAGGTGDLTAKFFPSGGRNRPCDARRYQ